MHPDNHALNEYADDTLDASQRASVDRHLEMCAECRSVVEDVRRVRRAAAALEPIAPPPHVWPKLQAAIGRQSAANARAGQVITNRTRLAWLAAAAALLFAVTLVGLRYRTAPSASVPASAIPAGTETPQSVESELRLAEEHYDRAIKGLEQLAGAGQGSLDPKTAATLQKNLEMIDQAISESRSAVQAQPTSEPAQQSLLENFRTKVAVLQDTVALINEMRKGDEAGAARIVSGLKQQR